MEKLPLPAPWLQALLREEVLSPLSGVQEPIPLDMLRDSLNSWAFTKRSYLARFESGDRLGELRAALRVIGYLEHPEREIMPLSEIAVRLFGSDHALDRRRNGSAASPRSLVLNFLRYRVTAEQVLTATKGRQALAGTDGLTERRLLRANRVVDGDISSTVSFAALENEDGVVRAANHAGVPCTLTLYDVERIETRWRARFGRVYAVENPSFFFAVYRATRSALGPKRQPSLICLSGNFSHASQALLESLDRTPITYSIDDDKGGKRIEARLNRLFGERAGRWTGARRFEEENIAEFLDHIADDLDTSVPPTILRKLRRESDLIRLSRDDGARLQVLLSPARAQAGTTRTPVG